MKTECENSSIVRRFPPGIPCSFTRFAGRPPGGDPIPRLGHPSNLLAGELPRGAQRPRAVPARQRVPTVRDRQRGSREGRRVHARGGRRGRERGGLAPPVAAAPRRAFQPPGRREGAAPVRGVAEAGRRGEPGGCGPGREAAVPPGDGGGGVHGGGRVGQG